MYGLNLQNLKGNIKYFLKTNAYFLSGLIIVIIYILPYIILNNKSPIQIHDNLDSNYVNYKLIAETNTVFTPSFEIIEPFMGGTYRLSFPSELNVIMLLFVLFPPLTAYIINMIIIHITAYLNMYKLLNNYVVKENGNHITVGVALCFGVLPFYPWLGLSIAGSPLILNSFLNIRSSKTSKSDFIFIILFPFYSNFPLAVLFFYFLLALIFIYDLIHNRVFNLKFNAMLSISLILSLITQYRNLFFLFGNHDYTSHRIDFRRSGYTGREFLDISDTVFREGYYHFASGPNYIIIWIIIILLLIFLSPYNYNQYKDETKILVCLFLAMIFISSIGPFIKTIYVINYTSEIRLATIFNWDRFYSLQPLFVYLSFAYSLIIFNKIPFKIKKYDLKITKSKKRIITHILIFLQLVFLISGSVPMYNHYWGSLRNENSITYNEFFDPELFGQIDNHINRSKNSYRVASLGLYPSITQYNGFYTVDGYIPNYSLDYKIQFRKIIEKELDKNQRLKDYYDNWGSRVYLFSAELGKNYLYTKETNKTIYNLEINTKKLYELGGEYIISAVRINNYLELNLDLIGIFETVTSIWQIFLYKNNNSDVCLNVEIF
jgi:hypothetical protein